MKRLPGVLGTVGRAHLQAQSLKAQHAVAVANHTNAVHLLTHPFLHIAFPQPLPDHGLVQPGARFICHHFSHNGGMLHEEMCARMNPEGFDIAYDGMTVEI